MAIKQQIMPYVAQVITSAPRRTVSRILFDLTRRVLPSRNKVTFFHKVDDPYSYLLLQTLPRLLQDFKVKLDIQFVLDLPPDDNPYPDKMRAYALNDAARLAEFHDISYPEVPRQPSPADAVTATAILVKHKNSPKLLHLCLEVTGALWNDSTTTFDSCERRYGTATEKETTAALQSGLDLLQHLGHYNSGMLHYGNEWYWGVDRLGHLTARLEKAGLARPNQELADYQKPYRHVLQSYNTLRPRPRQLKPTTFYFSFRSPYSYLAAERLFKLHDLYQFPLTLKPIMPMVTRGIPLSPAKRMYILQDAKREAERFHIPFGRIADPLGEGVEHCMALLSFAEVQGKAREYVMSVMTGIWSEGADVSQESVMKRLTERAGLDWKSALAHFNDTAWKQSAEENRQALDTLGLWGVPVICYGDLVVWGQDRLWTIEQDMLITRNGRQG